MNRSEKKARPVLLSLGRLFAATVFSCTLLAGGLPAPSLRAQEPAAQQPIPASHGSRFATVESASRDEWQKPDEVVRALDLKPGYVVVDLGAGTGYFTRRLAEAVAPEGRAIALEIEAALVRSLVADAKRWGLTNYEARLVPADDPMLAPASVDVIFVCDTYHHINDRVAYFRNARQALRPKGRLVIVDFVRTAENPEHSIVKQDVIDDLQRAGYRFAVELGFLWPKQYFLVFEPVPVSP
jgi:predicted methyltransferase